LDVAVWRDWVNVVIVGAMVLAVCLIPLYVLIDIRNGKGGKRK
jgi:hypothetical protein